MSASPSAYLKAALKARGWKYRDLADALEVDERALRNKISRGTFTAAWFLEVLAACGCTALDLTPPPAGLVRL